MNSIDIRFGKRYNIGVPNGTHENSLKKLKKWGVKMTAYQLSCILPLVIAFAIIGVIYGLVEWLYWH